MNHLEKRNNDPLKSFADEMMALTQQKPAGMMLPEVEPEPQADALEDFAAEMAALPSKPASPVAAAPGEPVIQKAPGAMRELYREINRRAGIAPTELPGKLWDVVKGAHLLSQAGTPTEALPMMAEGATGAVKTLLWPFSAANVGVNKLIESIGGSPVFPGTTDVPLEERGTVGDIAEIAAPFAPKVVKGISKTAGRAAIRNAGGILSDYRNAVRAGEWGQVQGAAEQALKGVGVKGKDIPRLLKDVRTSEALTSLREYGEATRFGVEGFVPYNTREALKALGYTGKEAQSLMLKAKKMPIQSVARYVTETMPESLIQTVPGSAARAITLELPEVQTGFHRALTLFLKNFAHPESVLGLEGPGKAVYATLREAQRKIVRDVAKLEKVLLGATKGLSHDELVQVGMILDGQKVKGASPAVKLASQTIRRHVLDPLARLHGLPAEGRMLKDYFPHFFDEAGTPKDIVNVFAEQLAAKQKLVFKTLESVEQGKFIEQASKMLRKIPQQVQFGPISRHRLTEASPFNYNASDVVARYIRGAVRKYHLDNSLKTVRSALPDMSPALKEYTTQYVNAFRGVPASGEVIANDAIRTMLDTLEKVPGVGKSLSRSWQSLMGTTSREGANTLKMIQADAKLGANLFSPIQNLSQTSINTYTKVGAKTLADALKLRYTSKGKTLLDRSGVFFDVAKYDFVPEELSGMKAKFTDKLLFLFNKSEMFNREIAYLAGYLKAQKANPKAAWVVLDNAGRHLVDVTQFRFDVGGRPLALTTPFGSTMGQFKLFTLNQLRFIKNLRGAEIPRFTMSIALHGGMKGIPGVQTLVKALVGYSAVQYVKDQELPDFVENLILGGLPRMAGVSLEQDVGLGFVPTSARELVPPTLSLPLEVMKSGPEAVRGEPAAREGILRESIRNLPGGIQLERVRQALLAAKRGGVKVSKQGRYEQKLSPRDLILQGALGGKTAPSASYREAQEFMEMQTQDIRTAQHRLRSELTKALADNNFRRFDAALAAASEAGVLIGTDLTTLGQPALVREFLSMPKKARIQILAENPGFRNLILRELGTIGLLEGE